MPVADFVNERVPDFSVVFLVIDDLVVDDDFLDMPPPNIAKSRMNVPKLDPIDSLQKVEHQPVRIVAFLVFNLGKEER